MVKNVQVVFTYLSLASKEYTQFSIEIVLCNYDETKIHVGCIVFRLVLQVNYKPLLTGPRSLDSELRAHSKNMEPGWDFRKLSFVLEAKGEVQQEELSRAQSNISSALQSSLNAGFNLFKTNLESDQLLHRRHLLASSGDEARARAAIVGQLEA